MSLTSRAVNLLSGSTSTQQNRNDFSFADDGVPRSKQAFDDIKLGRQGFRSENMASEEVEEEARPPYLHVREYTTGQMKLC